MAHQPKLLNIKGTQYKLCVYKVLQEDAQGQPLMLLAIGEQDIVHLQGGEKFITAYVATSNLTT